MIKVSAAFHLAHKLLGNITRHTGLWGLPWSILDVKSIGQGKGKGNLGWPEIWIFTDNRRFSKKEHFVASQAFTALMELNVLRNGNIMKLHAELIFHK